MTPEFALKKLEPIKGYTQNVGLGQFFINKFIKFFT